MSCFFDTNVLVYAVDARVPRKQRIALDLYAQALKSQNFVISTQVLIEFYNATTKGQQPMLKPHEAQMQLAALTRQYVVPTTAAMVVSASALVERYRLQWWDALLLEAALSVGANTLYSEDFQHGQRFDDLTVVNPFIAE